MTTIPDEAVVAAAQEFHEIGGSDWYRATPYEELPPLEKGVARSRAQVILEAAYPAIRAQVRAELFSELRKKAERDFVLTSHENALISGWLEEQEEAADAE